MAPSGLVISKLGVQATANGDHVAGLLCLKVSLPRETEGRPGARWALFSSQPPKLKSEPTIHPLPLSVPISHSRSTRIATTLLSLPTPSSYPPSSPSGLGSKPYIDVSGTTGKVFVVVDPIANPGRKGRSHQHQLQPQHNGGGSSSSPGSAQGAKRKDWLIIMEFEVPLEESVEQSISRVLLPLPKCLDNVIRFNIDSHPASSSRHSGEINILAEPRVLPLPSTAFQSPTQTRIRPRRSSSVSIKKRRKRNGDTSMEGEAGWEDGEEYGPEDSPSGEESEADVFSESEANSEDGYGCWLQGRFQSTDLLRLEWSLAPTNPDYDVPVLQVSPTWDRKRPSIDVLYTARIDDNESAIYLDVDVPDGWGWSDLAIEGSGLTSWQSTDVDWWDSADLKVSEEDPDATLELPEYEDSFSTLRAKRLRTPVHPLPKLETFPTPSSSQSSASLMRQTLPTPADMKMEDFSFEVGSLENVLNIKSHPSTPASARTPRTRLLSSTGSDPSQIPKPGREFKLTFAPIEDREIALRGTLVPLNALTLVSAKLPVQIPFIRLDSTSDGNAKKCFVTCSAAHLNVPNGELRAASDRLLCDISRGGSFTWQDLDGKPDTHAATSAINGDVQVRLGRNIWGVTTMSIRCAWPRRAEEIGFHLQSVGEARVVRVVSEGTALPRASHKDGDGKLYVRIGRKEGRDAGKIEITLELSSDGPLYMPVFEKATGTLSVELSGTGWESLLEKGYETNLIRSQSSLTTFTHDLASPSAPFFTLSASAAQSVSGSRSWRTAIRSWFRYFVFNPATMLNLFMIWVLISTVQRVDILKREVAFVADEARDLRLYGYGHRAESTSGHGQTMPPLANTHGDERFNERDDESSRSTVMVVEEPERSPSHRGSEVGHSGWKIALDTPATDTVPAAATGREKYPLGRVVFGHAGVGWERWIAHPTVRTISQSVAWLWHTVVWLIVPA